MLAVFLVLLAGACYVLGYRFYARKIARLWQIDANRPTPAVSRFDGVDYVPAKNWLVLFGHHFASIAGAGPIIGPVMAVTLWGWGPALLWVILGSIFIGGIHDFGALIVSVREDGTSIGDVSAKVISKKAKLILSIFIWLALILVIAVFAYLAAKTFVSQPEIITPSLGIIPVAVFLGWTMYHLKWSPVPVTVMALLALLGLLVWGAQQPVNWHTWGQGTWIVLLLGYCFIASILPVHVLLQPRDYISSFLLAGGVLLALCGILVSRPEVAVPFFTGAQSDIGMLWPMMFITVACGANSGFHSLIASGTTSKQLANEGQAQRVGFGGMLAEGFLAVIVIVLVISGFSRPEFRAHVAAKTNPVQLYGLAFGNMTSPFLGQWGKFAALSILNVFILTTLDSATRITRYMTEELFRVRNRWLSTAIVVLAGGGLALGKDSTNHPLWQKIWPAFGASNQLVAALALLVVSCWLLSKKRTVLYALIPAGFMLVTSVAALLVQIIGYFQKAEYLLLVISVVLVGAAGYLTAEVLKVFKAYRGNGHFWALNNKASS